MQVYIGADPRKLSVTIEVVDDQTFGPGSPGSRSLCRDAVSLPSLPAHRSTP